QQSVQIVNAAGRSSIVSHDDIALTQTGSLRRALVFNRGHQDAALARELMKAGNPPQDRHGLPGDADVTPPDFTVADQPARDELGRVDRNSEADTLSRQNDRAVDADHFAAGGDQGTARIAWIESRVGLDDVVYQAPRGRSERASQGAHHSRSHG